MSPEFWQGMALAGWMVLGVSLLAGVVMTIVDGWRFALTTLGILLGIITGAGVFGVIWVWLGCSLFDWTCT